MSMETHVRTIVKGISYRVLASVLTFGLTYLLTNSIAIATALGSLEAASKLVLFWIHERLWQRIRWGAAAHELHAKLGAAAAELPAANPIIIHHSERIQVHELASS